MTFLWTTKNADSIDVPNFDNHSDFHIEDNKSCHGNKSRHGKRRVSTILNQIDAKAAKRGSGVSVASSSNCDEVSVLSLHSAFLTNNLPIKEDAEFTTPSMINHDHGRSQSLTINPNGSGRSLGANTNTRRPSSSHLKSSQHASFSTMTFSDKSLPISQEDIESIEQSWIDNQQDDQNSIRSSGRVSLQGSTSRRKFSTQTYSEKGTVYSSIYKNYCDEESARSVTSNSFHDPGKQQTYNSYFQSSSTVGSARLCRDGSTRSTLVSTSTSNGHSQYEDVSLHLQPSVPNNTPTAVLSTKGSEMNEPLISNAVDKIHSKSTASKKKKIRSQKQSNTEISVTSAISSTSMNNHSHKQSSSSSTKTDDNTLLIKNNKSSGKPPLPLSKSSSSSSLTDDTTESRVQTELYRLSLELASTLSSLDFKKLEVTKYMKQVGELEAIIGKLTVEKEQLESKLERYETNERNAMEKIRGDHGDFISKKSSKKKGKKSKNGIEIEIENMIQTEKIIIEPNCVTPTSGEEDGNDPASQPTDENRMDESDILFPDLNESHLTCQDLYATMEEEDDNESVNDNNSTDDNTSSKSLNEDNESFANDDDFPSEILDTTVSLIDPREEIFDDDPFATVYDYGKRLKTQNEGNDEDDEMESLQHSVNDNRSVISLQWIPFINKDSRRKIDETKHGKHFFDDKQARKTYSDLNSSFRSTKTNVTAPVKKSNFFGFGF